MANIPLLAVAALVLPLTGLQVAVAQPTVDLQSLTFDQLSKAAGDARTAGNGAEYLRYMDALIARYPQFGRLGLSRARALAMLGDAERTAEQLNRLADHGFTYKIEEADFDRVRADPRVQAAAARLAANVRPIGTASRVDKIGIPRSRPEGIAWSPKERAFYIGSVETGEIFRMTESGAAPVYKPSEGKWEPLGMKASQDGGRLFACMNRRGDSPAAELVEFALPAMTVRGRTALPKQGAICNDLDLLADGRVAVTDFANGQVLLWSSGGFTPLIDNLRFANGIAADDSGRVLYIAHFNGVRALDLASRAQHDLEPQGTLIGGMDGLYWHKGALFGVQGTSAPTRVLRIRPGAAPSRSAQVTVLYANHDSLSEPTTAAVANGELAVLANTGLFSSVDNSDPHLVYLPLD